MGNCSCFRGSETIVVEYETTFPFPEWADYNCTITEEDTKIVRSTWEFVKGRSKGHTQSHTDMRSPLPPQRQSETNASPPMKGFFEFFDLYFKNLNSFDPSIDLLFTSIKDRSQAMARMLAFLIHQCDKLDEPHNVELLEKVMVIHNQIGLTMSHYIYLGKALVLTMKTIMGLEFTPEVYRAWVVVWSNFYRKIWPLMPPAKVIKVKSTVPIGKLRANKSAAKKDKRAQTYRVAPAPVKD